jgi:hypothetical protein
MSYDQAWGVIFIIIAMAFLIILVIVTKMNARLEELERNKATENLKLYREQWRQIMYPPGRSLTTQLNRAENQDT